MDIKTDQGSFKTTHWTKVLEAACPDTPDTSEAFARLYCDYWPPLYAYVRRRGLTPVDGEDLVQDFFTHLVSKHALAGLQREGGRFRSFLLKSLNNFLANEWHRAHTQKRGNGQRPLSINTGEAEARFALDAPDGETPESAFEKRWAFTLLEHVTECLRDEYRQAGKGQLFDQLRTCLHGDRSGPAYGLLATQCGISEGAIKVTVHRMRQRYGALLRQVISQTVSSPREVDEELRHLIGVVGK